MSNVIISDANSTDVDFLIYSSDYCPYCVAAKRYLKGHNLTFLEIDLSLEPEKRNKIIQETGHKTVPVIFDLRGELPVFIGGFDDLQSSGVV